MVCKILITVSLISVIIVQSVYSFSSSGSEYCYKLTDKNRTDFQVFRDLEKLNRTIVNDKSTFQNSDRRINDEVARESLLRVDGTSNENNLLKKDVPWYLKVPLIPVLFASSPTLPEGVCKRQAKRYLKELQNGTLWAVKMFDSSTKYPEGIITGHTRHFGNFDECYQLKTNHKPTDNLDEIGGKYCLVKVKYQKINSLSERGRGPYNLDFDSNDSAWEAIKEKGDFRRVKRYMLQLALCVPDVCSTSEIETALQKPLEVLGAEQQISIEVGIKGNCQAQKDEPKFSTYSKIYCYVILSLILLVIISTWYDSKMKITEDDNNSVIVDILLCFSASRNYRSITEISYNHPGLDTIHLLRAIGLCMVIFGHRLMQYYTNPLINSEYLELAYTIKSTILIFNGPLIVESFFAFGGILLAYYLLIELDKKKKVNFISAILIRYFRLTPSYLILILFIALILPHMGSGPYWEIKMGLERDTCLASWWANILYINNYVNTDNLCMFQTWYVAVDYHLYIIALFVIYYFWKMPRIIGYPFLISIIILGCLVPFFASYWYGVQALFLGFPYMHEIRDDHYFINHYIKTHERLPTYFLGVLGGAIIYDHSLLQWKMPKFLSKIPFVTTSIIVAVTSLLMAQQFYNPNINPSPVERALYASLNRPMFALAIVSSVVYITVDNGKNPGYNFFKPRWAQPMAKLTYGAYLIHHINQCYDIGVARHARTFSAHNIFWDAIPDIISSFFLSFLLALIVEGPFRRIEKRFIIGRITRKPTHKISESNGSNGVPTEKKINAQTNHERKND